MKCEQCGNELHSYECPVAQEALREAVRRGDFRFVEAMVCNRLVSEGRRNLEKFIESPLYAELFGYLPRDAGTAKPIPDIETEHGQDSQGEEGK